MVLWVATFNAVLVIGVVSLLLFELSLAILCTFWWPTDLHETVEQALIREICQVVQVHTITYLK